MERRGGECVSEETGPDLSGVPLKQINLIRIPLKRRERAPAAVASHLLAFCS